MLQIDHFIKLCFIFFSSLHNYYTINSLAYIIYIFQRLFVIKILYGLYYWISSNYKIKIKKSTITKFEQNILHFVHEYFNHERKMYFKPPSFSDHLLKGSLTNCVISGVGYNQLQSQCKSVTVMGHVTFK